MRLIIKKEHLIQIFKIRNNKTGIKLMYDVNNVYMIGIPLKIKYEENCR